ncbi:MAG: peptidase M1, partial [Actinomycetota bacterium]|nr:peptidase M1 [Actinomycetota bacterium]
MTRRLWCAGVLVIMLALALGGCTLRGHPSARKALQPSGGPSPNNSGQAASCPATYAAPDPHRPVIRLRFDLAADRRSVSGTESVRFTPDLPVTEMVFRLWPNGASAPAGTRLTVTRAAVARGGAFVARPGSQGTLLAIPLGRTAPAGAVITADLAFTLELPPPAFERWGSNGTTAWWASGHPLLAWERGRGWQRQPAVRFPSEAASSEAANTDLTVTAPAGDTVLMTGLTGPPQPLPAGRALWHAAAPTARDVSVAVGKFATRTATVAGSRITVGVSSDTVADVDGLMVETRRAVTALKPLFGPFPYPSLTVVALPSLSTGGIEYPGAIQVGPGGWHVVLPHEVAHQYFYGMVGDNQARDPWLDEAFATYSEALVNHDESHYLPALDLPSPVGAPMEAWGSDDKSYYATVYGKGAAALLTARSRAGGARFDAALRCYVAANAWKVARPDDLARALAGLPRALVVLR